MTNTSQLKHTLDSDNPIMKRTGHGLGIEMGEAANTLSTEPYKIFISVTLPLRHKIHAFFPGAGLNGGA